MGTYAFGPRARAAVRLRHLLSVHWVWLAGGFALAFAVPFVLADTLETKRDLFYGLYALSVAALFTIWARATGYDLVASIKRRWPATVLLGVAAGGVLAVMVVRTEDATSRTDGVQIVAAVAWRGVLYGITDGLLLSAFPILLVFAALRDSPLRRRAGGHAAVGPSRCSRRWR